MTSIDEEKINEVELSPELEILISEIERYYKDLKSHKVSANFSATEIRNYLSEKYDFKEKLPIEEITRNVVTMMNKWSLHSAHPRYFGLFVPGTSQVSVIADALVALYNPQLGAWGHSPVAIEIENLVLDYLLKKFEFDPTTSFANFTTGGTEANHTATITALHQRFPEHSQIGLRKISGEPLFYVSEEAHHSFVKISQMMGLGAESCRLVPTDDNMRMDMKELERLFVLDTINGLSPFMVVGTAGTTSSGAIDPLSQLAMFCEKNKLWFHVDAAWGGAAIMSEKTSQYLQGIELADSITCDAHKWFSVSMSAGMFFCKHRELVKETFRFKAPYLTSQGNGREDPANTTMQCSRRFTGLKLFMELAVKGEASIGESIEKSVNLAKSLRVILQENGWTLISETPLPVVCFTHPRIKSGEIELADILQKVIKRGNVWISSTILKGNIPVLRAGITSYKTELSDIDVLIDELEMALGG